MEPAPLPPPKAKVFRRFGPSIIAGVVVIFFAFAVLWSFRPSNSSDDADVVKLDKTATTLIPGAPEIEDPTGRKLEGITYTDFDGTKKELLANNRPLLVNFWASTCTPCITEMPALERIWQKNKDRIDVLGLDYFESVDAGLAMAKRTGVTYPLGRDEKGLLLKSFGGTGLPYTMVIGANGVVLRVHSGALTESEMQELVDTAVGR